MSHSFLDALRKNPQTVTHILMFPLYYNNEKLLGLGPLNEWRPVPTVTSTTHEFFSSCNPWSDVVIRQHLNQLGYRDALLMKPLEFLGRIDDLTLDDNGNIVIIN
jgi:hypothetical protein